ncbi:MAG: hypothetical protein ACTSPL_04250 [Candidatus Odinarchaeia archaeon]
MFIIIDSSGFQIKFKNNIIVSARFAPGTRSTAGKTFNDGQIIKFFDKWRSPDVELAVICETEKRSYWISRAVWMRLFGEDCGEDAVGYVRPKQFARVVSYCSHIPYDVVQDLIKETEELKARC